MFPYPDEEEYDQEEQDPEIQEEEEKATYTASFECFLFLVISEFEMNQSFSVLLVNI